MERIEVKDVDAHNVEDLIKFCIPIEKRENTLFLEGEKVKKRWLTSVMKRYGSFAKLAYLKGKPAGMIQYQPKLDKKLMVITCIFVSEKEFFRKGIGKALLNAFLDEMKEPKPYFGNDVPFAIIT
ncbi:MAG: GNAT family N-acetyltransferase [Spirochaetales bacterium]|nr:GNAT family N-acetyltransferase [Spirochaetales bacterium]